MAAFVGRCGAFLAKAVLGGTPLLSPNYPCTTRGAVSKWMGIIGYAITGMAIRT